MTAREMDGTPYQRDANQLIVAARQKRGFMKLTSNWAPAPFGIKQGRSVTPLSGVISQKSTTPMLASLQVAPNTPLRITTPFQSYLPDIVPDPLLQSVCVKQVIAVRRRDVVVAFGASAQPSQQHQQAVC